MAVANSKELPAGVKYGALFVTSLFVYVGNMYSSGLSTSFPQLAAHFRLSDSQLTGLLVWSVLAMGVSNLFWMPTALCFGKRPVVLLSMAIAVGGSIWGVVANSYNSLLASRIVASIGFGSIESLGPSILADLFSERYYATAMALYAFSLSAGSQVGPMIGGYVVEAREWRWFFVLCLIVVAFNLATALLLLPETLNSREVRVEGLTAFDIDKSVHAEQSIEEAHVENLESVAVEEHQKQMGWKAYCKSLAIVAVSDDAQKNGVLSHWLYLFCLPLPLLLVPGVLFASLSFGIVLGGVVVISSQSPALFSPPPYLFTSQDLGLFSLSTFIGVIVFWPVAGPLTDQLSRWMRKRNNGIHKPEYRLPGLLLAFLVSPTGLVVFGYTVSLQRHYVQPAIGAAMSTSGLTLVPAIVLAYVIDTYPGTSGEALVLINATKNVVAFCLAKECSQWMAKVGVAPMFYQLAGIQWAVLALGCPLYFAGEWMRLKTRRYS